ncbi:N-acetylmuramic acid 6-phosphate etherase [Lichenicoccus sp.]|uniref:N-acetylmuramic acid 6-phosphate etherase n=1 Tax=Lichenicoccus sp. TaxID=2781899 RepID=UPI003D123A6E
MSTEQASARFADLDSWPLPTQIAALYESQLDALAAIRPALPAITQAASAATARLRESDQGRLIYAGAGSSARIAAQDGAELAPTFDWPEARLLLLIAGGPAALTRAIEGAEDDTQAAGEMLGAHAIGPRDVMIALAASGATPFTLACASGAHAAGALTITIANSPGSPLLTQSSHPILIETGAEPIAGSTRLKAGTAQKVVLNLLSTAIMTGLGRVYAGRMVEMRASNTKLRQRAVAMVCTLAGCAPAAAQAALDACGMRVKPAILVAHGLDAPAAVALLATHRGDLRAALLAMPTLLAIDRPSS